MTEFIYTRIEEGQVNAWLANYAAAGWTIHTFNRNPNASVVDILWQRTESET